MDWNGYARYYDWEFDLICTEQRKDVNLWLKLAEKFGDPILELCCGSGRITIPLLKKGFTITAVDNSPQMLQILQKKAGNKVETVLSDMTSFHMKKKYKFVFISYSSFQQLLTQKEQLECLQRINEHLEDGGVLTLDINPNICDGPDILEKTHHYTAEFLPGNSTVTMYTTHRINRKNQVKHWEDTYLEIGKAGNERTFVNHISLKECSIEAMKKLLSKCGFEIEDIFGGFDLGSVKEDSSNLIYIVRKYNSRLLPC
jgi:ubiquinone/menaquinone biosynthesis C-methylase UbiE